MSSLLFNLLFAWKCTSTHHKFALDALNLMQGEAAANWRTLCLAQVGPYLAGAKAPDDQFKDFRNHVLHVRNGYWGGAVTATRQWYDKTVVALRSGNWPEAVYCAGVLSHYYTDPIQPFHTDQSEAEGVVHRAAEWSIACTYRELTELLETELGGWPVIDLPSGTDWLEQMVRAGAELAHPHYQICIDHYDIQRGVQDPPAGLDRELRQRIARLIGHAVVGYARIMERALAEACVVPPATSLSLPSVLATVQIPILWITRKMGDARERATVTQMFREYQTIGKVVHTLPKDDAVVRRAFAQEVLKTPVEQLDALKPGPIGQAHGTIERTGPMLRPASRPVAENAPATNAPTREDRSLRFYLSRDMPVEKAPSIGPKSARRLERHGIRTVGNLLQADPDDLAREVNDRSITGTVVEAWQIQAWLCCDVPQLRGHDAQILVACDVLSPDELASADPDDLLDLALAFIRTPTGVRVLRDSSPPDLPEVTQWIDRAKSSTRRRAA